jgi:hypothetical protein
MKFAYIADQHTNCPKPIFDVIKQVEKELLEIIEDKVEQMALTIDDASSLANDFLILLPLQTTQELCDKLQHLYKQHNACRPLYIKYAKGQDELRHSKKATILQELLQQNAIHRAYSLMIGGVL